MADPEWTLFMQDSNISMPVSTEQLRGMFSDIPSWLSMLRLAMGKAPVAQMTMHIDNGSQSNCKVIPREHQRPNSTYEHPLGRSS